MYITNKINRIIYVSHPTYIYIHLILLTHAVFYNNDNHMNDSDQYIPKSKRNGYYYHLTNMINIRYNTICNTIHNYIANIQTNRSKTKRYKRLVKIASKQHANHQTKTKAHGYSHVPFYSYSNTSV